VPATQVHIHMIHRGGGGGLTGARFDGKKKTENLFQIILSTKSRRGIQKRERIS
jgi:hypothetical protein